MHSGSAGTMPYSPCGAGRSRRASDRRAFPPACKMNFRNMRWWGRPRRREKCTRRLVFPVDTDIDAGPHHEVTSDSMKLSALLRGWRQEAGERLRRGRALPQKEVAHRMGVSERWYRGLENDEPVSLPPETLTRLADALELGLDERLALYARTLGAVRFTPSEQEGLDGATALFRELFAAQSRHPAYLTDRRWNVIGYNSVMAAWFPWVLRPSANLLRWTLGDPQARQQLVDWRDNARVYLAQLRFSMVNNPGDAELEHLLSDVLADPECRALWEKDSRVVAYRQGHPFRLRIPAVSSEDITVTSEVLLPAYHDGFRFVVLLPAEKAAEEAVEKAAEKAAEKE
ncbi:helix-turn-helix domain-containing protein [Streptomyces sp. NPDC006134]|uniref:helix-turn-helix domain-containing protein n=1 Tax=Streptomyces sp. NPDC006134 TaxID=3154467 RepID=UPI0033C73364